MDKIPVFYAEEMLAESDSRSPSAEKPRHVVSAWEHAGLPIELRPIVPVSVEDLRLAHEPAFVRSILACEADNGFENRRPDVAKSLPYTNGAMLGAASLALQCGIACAPVSGFHHAEYDVAKWFCTFNGLMVTALKLLHDQRVRRIMILDLDQHFGDGTDEIIGRLKISGVENVTFGRWYSNETFADEYMTTLEQQGRRFSDFDMILFQAGADVHIDDPLGGVLTTEQMRERDRMVFAAAKSSGTPLAWNLAGGYQEPVSKVVALHVNTMRECAAVYCAN
jgi:acetoin utilization deacetylase AcuC-like enzyme